ncbi:hypothetical protein P0W64_12325 [Tsukamurella sp. 8F]|uniref:hypothetical protein n=1 Tax=unclassified Tsukamurella TaxID=2633480 RepID=UPI0023B9404C|nr:MULTISPECIES: hypothetical protein [unclassified Tsukamurella]MDF0531592.1 hypothetical protein [Tsukamurella sp. 8J]MDF0587561.1 hypothetical protein [Tsukamurella sp. 8F]
MTESHPWIGIVVLIAAAVGLAAACLASAPAILTTKQYVGRALGSGAIVAGSALLAVIGLLLVAGW